MDFAVTAGARMTKSRRARMSSQATPITKTPHCKLNQQNQMNTLQTFIKSQPYGFITDKELLKLVAIDRLCQVLVRCGGCRFTCAAQDVAHLETCIKAGGDYVRDVSFPVGSFERAASWQPAPAAYTVETARRALKHASVATTARVVREWNCEDLGDGPSDADPGL